MLFVETVQNADGPLLVEISRSIGCDLGIALKQILVCGKPVIILDTIYTASIAERFVEEHMQCPALLGV